MTARFPVIRVTLEVEELIQDLEAALMRLAVCLPGTQSENAYAALNQRRKELYLYIARLEASTSEYRCVIKRFE